MQSNLGKAKILSARKSHLKPGGKFLAHEMLIFNNEIEVRKNLSQAIRVNTNPLTFFEWANACEKSGLRMQKEQIGEMKLLSIDRIVQDEGFLGAVKIVWKVLTNGNLRSRVLQMRRNFKKYHNDISYIVFMAEVDSSFESVVGK